MLSALNLLSACLLNVLFDRDYRANRRIGRRDESVRRHRCAARRLPSVAVNRSSSHLEMSAGAIGSLRRTVFKPSIAEDRAERWTHRVRQHQPMQTFYRYLNTLTVQFIHNTWLSFTTELDCSRQGTCTSPSSSSALLRSYPIESVNRLLYGRKERHQTANTSQHDRRVLRMCLVIVALPTCPRMPKL